MHCSTASARIHWNKAIYKAGNAPRATPLDLEAHLAHVGCADPRARENGAEDLCKEDVGGGVLESALCTHGKRDSRPETDTETQHFILVQQTPLV